MVATTRHYTDSLYQTSDYSTMTGVVQITTDTGYRGTGTLLWDGQTVLTAAHLFDPEIDRAEVIFENSHQQFKTVQATQYQIHPFYEPLHDNHDLALVRLSEKAPGFAQRFELYREDDAIGQTFAFGGYGTPGTGLEGSDPNATDNPRLIAANRFETEGSTLKEVLGAAMGWTPKPGTTLVADFDSGNTSEDALGGLLGIYDTGLGDEEGLITSGDSGGPAFIDGKIAGVASYTSSLGTYDFEPDVDLYDNSSFGEQGFWQRVAYDDHQQWIDQSVRDAYGQAPKEVSEIDFEIFENDSGDISYAYFLIEFHGERFTNDWLSVDYQTRDGTATAGEDYLPQQGTLVLYPDENQAVMPVEILGDDQVEDDETFYLDVTNPVGGSFPNGVDTLSAMRTIVDDDMLIA
ncbi:Calx-beta domain-containing protein [Hydrogenovibrio halophilus]|uniref:Calx-beta domain-containing protein n=1 Tax=Hydrogenovibrio halophilus TaxID=373391 RepID=UPI00037FBD7C|nr:Calx-beta domain-containing protein [Hydrogenovibrio halophilus]